MEEQAASWQELIKIGFDNGVPTGVLILVVIGLGVGIWRLCAWAAPKADMIVDSHLSLISHLKEAEGKQTKIMERQQEQLDEHGTILKEHGEVLEEISVKLH